MQRGATYDEVQDPSLGSHWGPLSKSEDGEICPEWVHLRLTSTKTTGLLEVRIPFCPTEPALCPVLALYSYVKMHVGLPMAHHVGPTSPIWLITNSDMTSGKKCFRPLGTADPIAKDTKTAMTDAGISDAYGAHALRSASASAHLNKGASEIDLMAFARWSSTSVFRKFYARTKAKEFSVLDVFLPLRRGLSPLLLLLYPPRFRRLRHPFLQDSIIGRRVPHFKYLVPSGGNRRRAGGL